MNNRRHPASPEKRIESAGWHLSLVKTRRDYLGPIADELELAKPDYLRLVPEVPAREMSNAESQDEQLAARIDEIDEDVKSFESHSFTVEAEQHEQPIEPARVNVPERPVNLKPIRTAEEIDRLRYKQDARALVAAAYKESDQITKDQRDAPAA